MSLVIPVAAADHTKSTVTLPNPVVAAPTGNTFFVSASGNDSANGTSQATAWRTLNKVNQMCAAGAFKLGDSILFHNGDTFYGRLVTQAGLNPTGGLYLTFGSYGVSAQQPLISQYKLCNIASGWVSQGNNVWALNYSAANAGVTYTGDPSGQLGTFGYDVGFIKIGGGSDTPLSLKGTIMANKQLSMGGLAKQWDFYADNVNGVLYVHSTANPTTLTSDIRIATGGWSAFPSVLMFSGVRLNNLAFMGNGGHCVDIGGGINWNQILGCTIAEIGGALLIPNTSILYGNGVSYSDGNSNVLISGNNFRDIYNVAFTLQENGPYTNITFTKNLMWRCVQAVEYDCQSGPGNGFNNCVDTFNTSLFAGYTPFVTAANLGNLLAACHQLTFQWTCTTPQLAISKNVYYDALEFFSYSYSLTQPSPIPTGFNSTNNYIAMRSGALMQSADNGIPGTINNPSGWVTQTNREHGSVFNVLSLPAPTVVTDAMVTTALAALQIAAPTFGIIGGGRPNPVLV